MCVIVKPLYIGNTCWSGQQSARRHPSGASS